MPFQRVVAYAPAGTVALGLGQAASVFRPRAGLTDFAFAVCADRPGLVMTDLGTPFHAFHGVSALARADLALVLPGAYLPGRPSAAAVAALRAAHQRGAIVAAHCAGVFLLAASGLLDGRAATTHWQYAGPLAARYPQVDVRADALYVDEGRVVTGAGAAAGMDLYLHLVRREHGAALANALARLLVVPPHRDGGQQQFVASPVPADDGGALLADVIAWARAHLHQDLSLDALAGRALMSRRSFARHFTAATGTTPHAWVVGQRLALAEELLETTDLTVAEIAARVGYGSAPVLREQFVRRRGLPPTAYRRSFAR